MIGNTRTTGASTGHYAAMRTSSAPMEEHAAAVRRPDGRRMRRAWRLINFHCFRNFQQMLKINLLLKLLVLFH
jgi:hypothetical protein